MTLRRPTALDAALATAAAVALVCEGALRARGGLPAPYSLLAVVAAAPLAWRSQAPVASLLAIEAGAVACVLAFRPAASATAIVVLMLYTVAVSGHRRRSVILGALTALGVVATIAIIGSLAETTSLALRLALVVIALAVGETVRSRRALRAAERERARRLEREREEDGRRRVADERLRIARELHDTLAHSLVAINVRSGVAAELNGSQDPQPALLDIQDVSAAALRDLRATLGFLRSPHDTAPTTPASDLASLGELVDQARSGGLEADIDLNLKGAAVPSIVGAAAFRIVQEALTNVLRHAHATSAHVRISASPDALDLEITDDGRAHSADARPGLGLRGMSERAAALGGQLDVGPREGGGWRVHAMLPLSGASA